MVDDHEDSEEETEEETEDNEHQSSLISIHNHSTDGLYHPENAPTFEQYFEKDDVYIQFGGKTKSKPREDMQDINLNPERQDNKEMFYDEEKVDRFNQTDSIINPVPPPRPNHPPPKYFQKLRKFGVPVPGDYPLNMTVGWVQRAGLMSDSNIQFQERVGKIKRQFRNWK